MLIRTASAFESSIANADTRLFETAKDGILILDANTGQITDVNPFLIDMLGYSHQEFLGKTLWNVSPFPTLTSTPRTMTLRGLPSRKKISTP